MKTIAVDRYITPLREGGSLPAIIEADDQKLYVLKFRGAGQGAKVLIAELLAGEIARVAGLRVPELAFATLNPELARTEPDPEVQSLIRASDGLNIAMNYLPGAVTFDPVAQTVDAETSSKIVWFDAFITNVDRTVRNANMLMWQKKLWLIDHGAALYFHYSWGDGHPKSANPFPLIKDHVLLKSATEIEKADVEMKQKITPEEIRRIVALIPDSWLEDDPAFSTHQEHREAYSRYFEERLRDSRFFVQEALRAAAQNV